MPYTEAQRRAQLNYRRKSMDQFSFRYHKRFGINDKVAEHIAKTGESKSMFVLRAIRETIERDAANDYRVQKIEEPTEEDEE